MSYSTDIQSRAGELCNDPKLQNTSKVYSPVSLGLIFSQSIHPLIANPHHQSKFTVPHCVKVNLQILILKPHHHSKSTFLHHVASSPVEVYSPTMRGLIISQSTDPHHHFKSTFLHREASSPVQVYSPTLRGLIISLQPLIAKPHHQPKSTSPHRMASSTGSSPSLTP
ncbi:hypothetical protein J6590_013876 [Homalodisca vitripennis]|nr:hypothetical protein J6590_013876 [Homalodisca vitripennis]